MAVEEKDLKKEEKKKRKKMTVTGMQESQAKIILATKIPAAVSFLNEQRFYADVGSFTLHGVLSINKRSTITWP